MSTRTIPAEKTRDLRLDLFLGLANWFIFLDHIPDNKVNWITVRNYGFSGAADWFIFISGYIAAHMYARMMLERGFIVGATRIFQRACQLYAAYVVLFIIYIVTIGDAATHYAAPEIIYQFNVAGIVDHPIRTVGHGLALQSRARNLDLLQLYIALMAAFAPALWAMLRRPNLTMAGSVALYIAARQFGWNLPSFPDGDWYFNPFCWQLPFLFGARLALGETKGLRFIFRSPSIVCFGVGYLVFGLAMTMAGRFPSFGEIFAPWLFDAFNPNDKTDLAPYRVLHFIVAAGLVARFVRKEWHGLQWPIFRPLIVCGEQSLAVFCVGVLLSFAGQLALITSSGSLLAQISVSAAGIAATALVACCISWSRQQDTLLPSRAS